MGSAFRLKSSVLLGRPALLGPLVLYVASLPPGVAFWDTGEMQTVPYMLGIAHPTGFPVFTLVGWAFGHLFPFGQVAWRMGVMSAIAMALAARLVYSLARELGATPLAALGGAWLFAVGPVAWTRGARTEVHAFAVALGAWAIVCGVRFVREGRPRDALLAALALGLGLANHPVAVLLVPGLLVLAVAGRRHLRPALAIRIVGIVAACLALYAYLPLRSLWVGAHHLDPTLALGVGPGRPYWNYDDPSTWSNFLVEVGGGQFDVGRGLGGVVSPAGYLAAATSWVRGAAAESGTIALLGGLAGVALVAAEMPLVALGVLLCGTLAIPFVLNFHAESDVDRYFLASYVVLAAFAAAGLSRCARIAAEKRPRLGEIAVAVLFTVAIARVAAVDAPSILALRRDESATRYVDRVIATTPPNAVIIADWAYATPLAYAAYVERRLGARIVETAWVGDDAAFIPAWIRRRPVYAVSTGVPRVPGVRTLVRDAAQPYVFQFVP